MSYIINKTNGSVLTEVIDGTIDQTASDITLVGKNASSYGEFFNENFIRILENFANTNAPNYPVQGQLWYDTSEARLKIYDGSGFKVAGGTIVSNNVPSSIAQGDLWIDSTRQQLYFNDGVATLLAGPIYTKTQGISGFQTVDIIDTNTIQHTVVFMYVAQVLIGIFSKDAFTPADTIPGYTGSIEIGFNVSNYSGIKFNVPVSQAEFLIAADSTLKSAESFVSTTEDSTTTGTLGLLNEIPLILGLSQNFEVTVDTESMLIRSNISNQNFEINLKNNTTTSPSLHIDAQNEFVGLYTDSPAATLDVNGDVIIRGDLTVEGNITSVNQTEINIEDIIINLGKTADPSNSTANGGGILLEGGTDGDKTLTWGSTSEAWDSSENFNLSSGKVYKINNFDVLSSTELGISVTSAPGLSTIGTLDALQVDNLYFNGNTISYISGSLSYGDVVLAPLGTGSVDVSDKRIISLADPVDDTDAVNKQTLVNNVQTAPLGLSINVGALNDAQIIANILNKIYPVSDHQEGTICRVWCIDTSAGKQFALVGGVWTGSAPI